MTTIHRPPLAVIHDQRRPVPRCIGCGDEGHTLKDCPDETEGRRIARGRAVALTHFSLRRNSKLRGEGE